jgi:hypothetical protein
MRPELQSPSAWELYLESLTPEQRSALADSLAYYARDTWPLAYVAALYERLDTLTAALDWFAPTMPQHARWAAELEELERLIDLHNPNPRGA